MKFQYKITLCVIMILAITFGIGGSILITSTFRAALQREEEVDIRTYEVVLGALDNVLGSKSNNQAADMHTVLYQLDHQNNTWYGIRLKTEDSIVYQNEKDVEFSDIVLPQSSRKCMLQIIEVSGNRYLQISSNFVADSETLRLDIMFDLKELYWSREVQLRNFKRIFCGIIFIGITISYIISGFLTKSLINVSKTLQKIIAGDLSCRVRVTTNDEVGSVAADINKMTERLEKNILDLQEEMNRKEEFLGCFAHEVKTPITTIIGYSELLRGHDLSDYERVMASNYILSEGKRLENLSKKILQLVVIDKDELELMPCNPMELIRDVIDGIALSMETDSIQIVTDLESGICLLESDLVRSLLINLIDNARKAIKENGIIMIRQKMLPNGCVISVEDNGQGIPECDLNRITQAFYRVDKSRSRTQGGAGLGLSLCSKIVELHNGTLCIRSKLSEGTVVEVVLKGGAV